MNNTYATIISKLDNFLDNPDKTITLRKLNEFIEKESGQAMFVSESLKEIRRKGFFQFCNNYKNYNINILLYIDTKFEEYGFDTKFQIKDIIIVVN